MDPYPREEGSTHVPAGGVAVAIAASPLSPRSLVHRKCLFYYHFLFSFPNKVMVYVSRFFGSEVQNEPLKRNRKIKHFSDQR